MLGVALAGCGLSVPKPLAGGDIYVGEDAAAVTVRTDQVEGGSVYLEGAQRFLRIDGPSSAQWAVDDGSGGGRPVNGRYLIGMQEISVAPGDYTLTAWERVCDGSCANLDEPHGHCTLAFTADPGRTVTVLVTYTVPDPCAVEVVD